jgi:kynurenine formamidase
MTRQLIDLSHQIYDGLVTYPGLPAPEFSDHLTREASRQVYAPGTEFSIGRITMIGNTGTYMDSPFHRYPDGADLAGIDLARVVDVPGVIVRVDQGGPRAIGRARLGDIEAAGRAVLIHTGWDRHWATDAYGKGHPFLAPDAVEWLAKQRPALVGIDSLNIDDAPADGTRPAHSGLLAAGIPIVEHLTHLELLPLTGFRFTAAPSPMQGFGTWPVRAYAVIED